MFVRSPITSTDTSWANGTFWYSDDTPGSGRAARRAGATSRTASTTSRRCSGVVPQQPPTSPSPNSRTKPDSATASSVGDKG